MTKVEKDGAGQAAPIIALDEKIQLVWDWLEEKQAADIAALDVTGVCPITETLFLASARNARHAQALADHILQKLGELKQSYMGMEGYQAGQWILLDLNDIVVHLFMDDTRGLYNLEGLWGDGKAIERQKDRLPGREIAQISDDLENSVGARIEAAKVAKKEAKKAKVEKTKAKAARKADEMQAKKAPAKPKAAPKPKVPVADSKAPDAESKDFDDFDDMGEIPDFLASDAEAPAKPAPKPAAKTGDKKPAAKKTVGKSTGKSTGKSSGASKASGSSGSKPGGGSKPAAKKTSGSAKSGSATGKAPARKPAAKKPAAKKD